ncbi:MAG: hypothetical protein VBE63_28905 [Lamprobacter sp.]|uniref:hypothetical protein n=1 Tax=Lamprobacter sp. TaxID=3100796 RepID=UPI002B25B3F6|nr:hypothetical protein [Lamprobacter sp.]MEA3643916.1 hypothetical protein [Lamprobacter sp.]
MDTDSYRRIAEHFQQSIDDLAQAVDLVAPALDSGAMLITRALMDDGKLLCCAAGPDAALARFTADRLMHSINHERPPLPALALTAASDGAGASSSQLWRDTRALCGSRDVLLCIDSSARGLAGQQALNVARGGNHPLLLLSKQRPDALPAEPPVCLLQTGGASRAQRLNLYTQLLSALCHLVEFNLFGE